MSIFDYAIQMEKDGEAFYRALAEKSSDKGIKHILLMLADAEVKHQEVLLEMKGSLPSRLAESTLVHDAKNVFTDLQKRPDEFVADASQAELYRKARDLEEKARAYYQQEADEHPDVEQKALLLKMAKQEEQHYRILDDILTLITRPEPGQWLENAEWNHMDEY